MNTRSFLTLTCGVLAAICGSSLAAEGVSKPQAATKAVATANDLASRWRLERDAHLQFFPDAPHDASSMLIQWSKDADEASRDTLRKLLSLETLETWDLVPGLEHVYVPGNVEEAIKLAEAIGGGMGIVEYAEPDHFYSIIATPNDPGYGLCWGLNNTGQTVNGDAGTADNDIDANLAWDVTTGSSTFVVGIADSGIRATHEDITANRWTNSGEIAGNRVDDDRNGLVDDVWGWDFWNNDADPTDDNGHGTHTAGTVGAKGNNARGVTGVSWNVKLAGLKIGSRTGSISTTAAISAINYCVGKQIRLSNHSWGGPGANTSLSTAISNARTSGHLLVCASGNSAVNSDTTPFYPAAYTQDNIISVAAIDNDGRLASFSNYGATSVDIGAPGVNIRSTYISNNSNVTYAYLSGTSMAAPHVTGVAALVWSVNPAWTYSQVRSKILSTVKPLPSLSGKCVTGGLLNANNAVR